MIPSTARLAAVVALVSGISCGTALADTMTGSLTFGGGPTNYYNPANGFVPAGYSNSTSATVTLAGGTTATFGYDDFIYFDTAAFTTGQLQIEIQPDVFGDFGEISTTWTFTASASGFFTGWTLSSDTFAPALASWSVDGTGRTLTVNWDGTNGGPLSQFDAIFSSSTTAPVPGPIVGAGLPGLALAFGGILAWRRRKREMA
jgi:hypothetical protein